MEFPPLEIAGVLAKLYFDSFESTHRILHAPSFWIDFERWKSGEKLPVDTRLIVLLVISIGSSLSGEPPIGSGLSEDIFQWVHAAQAWLSGPMEKSQLCISGLQVYCLTILARQVLSISGDLTWVSAGALLHQALQMGLNRDPSRLPRTSSVQAEIRRRLWATVLEIVLQASLDTAMNPRLSDEDFDVEPPTNVNDDELNSATSMIPQRDSVYTDATIQRLLLRSAPIRLRALKLLNGLHNTLYYPDVLQLSESILEACEASKAVMKEFPTSQFRRNLLDYLQRRILLPLHCLFANQARTRPLFHYSLKRVFDTAVMIVAPAADPTFSRLMCRGGSMFREGIRYGSIIVGLEVLSQARVHADPISKNNVILLKELTQNLIDLSIERIQSETNVKNPMFLSMVMTQAETIEQGRPSQLIMAQAARDSLQGCYEILQARENALFLSDQATGTSASPFNDMEGFEFDLDLDFFLPDMHN